MKNTKKISVLNRAIEMTESGKVKYDWMDIEYCNCGIVSLATGNFTHEQISKATGMSAWGDGICSAGNKCPTTGLFICDVQQALYESGFTAIELYELEILGSPYIAKKLGWAAPIQSSGRIGCLKADGRYKSKENFIAYLRAWVSILSEEDAKETPKEEVKERIVYVVVSEKITSEAKELILK